MDLQNKAALVTGGSRGLGLGVVEALAARGANVTIVARTPRDLEAAATRLGVATIAADVTDRAEAIRILAAVNPCILVLNAGAPPAMAPLTEQTWESFSNTWETDVKAGLHWLQAALLTPLAPGSRVLVVSSGAAVAGSPLSGGYAGAKRMLWILADYARALAADRALGIRVQTIVPRQMVGGTGIGDAGSTAYSARMGISREAFLARFGAPLPPRQFGEHVVALLTDPRLEDAHTFDLKGETGLTILEGAQA